MCRVPVNKPGEFFREENSSKTEKSTTCNSASAIANHSLFSLASKRKEPTVQSSSNADAFFQKIFKPKTIKSSAESENQDKPNKGEQ